MVNKKNNDALLGCFGFLLVVFSFFFGLGVILFAYAIRLAVVIGVIAAAVWLAMQFV